MGLFLRKYYSSSHRIDGKVVSNYIGDNMFGRHLAALAADRMATRRAQSLALHQARQALSDAESALIELDTSLNSLVAAYREACGYHLHKGQWRKRRGHPPQSEHESE